MDAHPISIDDGDVTDIQYRPADLWRHQQGQASYYAETYSGGLTDARAEFRFNGTGVTVYGVATPQPSQNQSAIPPSASFAVDSGISLTVVSLPDLKQTEYSHEFYNSRALSPGEHVLQINVTYGVDDWPFVLDYIQYTPLPQHSTTANATVAVGDGKQRSGHAGAIAGGVVASAAVLVIVALLKWWLYSRRASARLAKKHGLYVHPDSKTRVDLLDTECKVSPPSPILAHWQSHTDTVSTHAGQEMRVYSYAPGPAGTEVVMYLPPESQHTAGDIEFALASRRTSLHSQQDRPSTPLAFVQQPPATPTSASFGMLPRSETPSSAHRVPLTPPVTAYRRDTPESLTIMYRTATPEPSVFSHSSNSHSDSIAPPRLQLAPGSTQTGSRWIPSSKRAEAEAASRAKHTTFYADSGARFTSGGAAIHGPSTSVQAQGGMGQLEEMREEKHRRVSLGGSAISEVPPVYTEA